MGHLCATAEPDGPFGAATGPAGWPVGPSAMVAVRAGHAEHPTLQTIARSVAGLRQRDPGSPPGQPERAWLASRRRVNRARGR